MVASNRSENNRSIHRAQTWIRAHSVAISAFALAAAFVFCFHKTIAGLHSLYSASAEYSYALAIPFVSGFFIWQNRERLKQATIESSWLGAVFFFLFLLFSLYGTLGSSPSAVRPVLPLIILSITLFCFGRSVFNALLFPLFLLLFMIPLPTLLQTRIGVGLQIVSTNLGVFFLRQMGISVFVEGNLIDLGFTQLQVVEACSGLRYVLPLLALGFIFARQFEKNRFRQAVLVLTTIPISIVANSTRIAITGFLAQHYGLDVADRFFHGFSGWLIFVLSIGALFCVQSILPFLWPGSSGPVDKPAGEGFHKVQTAGAGSHRLPVAVACCSLLLAGWLNISTEALRPIRLEGGFGRFPLHLQQWTGRTESLDERIVRLSGAEKAFNAAYFSPSGKIVSLYMGYRGSPFTESENFFHSPNVCLPSLGWETLQIENHTIADAPVFGRLAVRKMLIEKMGVRQLVYYWFQTNRHVSADVHLNRLHLTLHALQRNSTYDLFIRPMTPLAANESITSAEDRLDAFTRTLVSVLDVFLAENIVVPASGR